MTGFKLEELAREAGVAARTVRYYVQRGLLPPPVFRGRDTTYDEGHLLRLRAIKRLQEAFLPLDEIAARLAGAGDAGLRALAEGRGAAGPGKSSAAPKAGPAPGPYEEGARRAWVRVALMDGLELHVRDDAPPEARRAARDVEAMIRARRHRGADS